MEDAKGATKTCPLCFEAIHPSAVRCCHCAGDLAPQRPAWERLLTVLMDTAWASFMLCVAWALGAPRFGGHGGMLEAVGTVIMIETLAVAAFAAVRMAPKRAPAKAPKSQASGAPTQVAGGALQTGR